MSRHICTKQLYKSYLQASSVRYSGLALSEVSPCEISHDAVSRWLKDKHFRSREVWEIAKKHINASEESIFDDYQVTRYLVINCMHPCIKLTLTTRTLLLPQPSPSPTLRALASSAHYV
jgi:hypothetical protein